MASTMPLEPAYDGSTTVVVDDAKIQPFDIDHWLQIYGGNGFADAFVAYLPDGKPFRARVSTSGPCSIVNIDWWLKNVHGKTFPWIGQQKITIGDESMLSLDPSCRAHLYPGHFKDQKDGSNIPRPRTLGRNTWLSDAEYEEYCRHLSPGADAVPLEGFAFSILPLIVAGRTHFVPVMISPMKFPVGQVGNNEYSQTEQPTAPEPGDYLDGIIHINTFSELGIKTGFSGGDSLHGKLIVSTRMPDFEFVPHPQTTETVIRLEIMGAADITDKGVKPVEAKSCAVFVCGPDSMYNKVWETPLDGLETPIGAAHRATIYGILHAMETALSCKKKYGYHYNRAVVCANSYEIIRDLKQWNERLHVDTVADVEKRYNKLADVWGKCFLLLQRARHRTGFIFEFVLLPSHRQQVMGEMVRKYIEQEAPVTGPRSDSETYVVVSDITQPTAQVLIKLALQPRCLNSDVQSSEPSERIILRNDVMNVLPKGFLVKIGGGEPQNPHLRPPMLAVASPSPRRKRKAVEPTASPPPCHIQPPKSRTYPPKKSSKLHRGDSPTKQEKSEDKRSAVQTNAVQDYNDRVQAAAAQDYDILADHQFNSLKQLKAYLAEAIRNCATEEDRQAMADNWWALPEALKREFEAPATLTGPLLDDETMMKNIQATLEDEDDAYEYLSDFSCAATPSPSPPQSVMELDESSDEDVPEFTRSRSVSPFDLAEGCPGTPRDYIGEGDGHSLEVQAAEEDCQEDCQQADEPKEEEVCRVEPPVHVGFGDENCGPDTVILTPRWHPTKSPSKSPSKRRKTGKTVDGEDNADFTMKLRPRSSKMLNTME
ncbi:hypothetical protein TWF696_009516 [Orbilia brochopaga]|uniref:Uncharacterized protein n=1 Tax=Orbilia brochopaga TaxID=3140254 RepID=A0AAV9UD21_9PEZI